MLPSTIFNNGFPVRITFPFKEWCYPWHNSKFEFSTGIPFREHHNPQHNLALDPVGQVLQCWVTLDLLCHSGSGPHRGLLWGPWRLDCSVVASVLLLLPLAGKQNGNSQCHSAVILASFIGPILCHVAHNIPANLPYILLLPCWILLSECCFSWRLTKKAIWRLLYPLRN